MSKKVSYNDIKDSTVDWGLDEANGLPYSGQSVQKFIRKHTQMAVDNKSDKIEAIAWDASTMSHLLFSSVANYEEWLESGDNLLAKQIVPFQIAGKQYNMTVINVLGNNNLYFTTNAETAPIEVGYLSQEKEITATNWTEVVEDAYISVFIDRGNTGSWTQIVTDQRVQYGNTYTFDVRKNLATGSNRVRVVAVGETTGQQGSLIIYANLTSMYLQASNFAWNTPFIEGTAYSLGGMNIGGNLSKTLKIKVSDENLYTKEYSVNIGTATYINQAYYYSGLEFPAAGTGVYNVDIWLEAENITSDHLVYNIMCVASSDALTAQLVAISEVPDTVKNYDTNTLFYYSCYNGGKTIASPSVRVQSIINNLPTTIVEETLQSVATATAHPYTVSLEIDTQETNIALSASITFGNEQDAYYAIDNSLSFPAVDADTYKLLMYFNPANRSNAQENRKDFINDYDGSTVSATWENVSFINGMDGWTNDNDGRKCLLIPAGSSVEVDYAPLNNATTRTIEFAYKVMTASDYDEDVITIASSDDSDFIGIKIKPTNVLLHSNLLRDADLTQSYNTKDEEFVHVLITLVKSYKNIGNLAQIYVNGVKACSFEWSSTDQFSTSANLKIGSTSADIYLYKMLVYDSGFEWPAAMQNFIASLNGSESKKAAAEKMNSVLDDNYALNYDEIYGKLNTFVVELPDGYELPNKLTNPSNTAVNGSNLYINIVQDPECSINGDWLNVPIEGQGTTAMTYYRWNLRSKTSSAYDKFRITAKKNVASSMHSHKMGATALFNDLNRMIVGANEADGRVAVYQYGCYGFLKKLVEGTTDQYIYEPIGLYTVGPDKGDASTFGYDNEDYEDTLIHMEGVDHTPQGVGMDYPWEQLAFSASVEALGAIKADGSVNPAWEVGECAGLSTDKADDESAIKAYLDQEFQPAYKFDYLNTSMLVALPSGTDMATINASSSSLSTFRATVADNGFTYGDCLIYIDGEYDTYYYNIAQSLYVKDGVNILDDLGISEDDLVGTTLETRLYEIRDLRKMRYRSEVGNYWHLRDSLFQYAFNLLLCATDNFKKNTYPYKFGTLASGSRWRWRADDLDTLFDINNLGLANKIYSLMNGDVNTDAQGNVTHLFRGNSSYHWRNIQEYYPNEIKAMMLEILEAMASLCPNGYGSSLIEKAIGCIRLYFWDKAQNYFTNSAYNVDAEWTYEDTWGLYKTDPSINAVHPLNQSLGSHYEAERAWVERRFIFMASMYGFGAFAHYDDTSLGQLNFRPSGDNTFNIVPAIDMNPAIVSGQGNIIAAGKRVKAGETVEINVPMSSSADTIICVQATDYIQDLGDMKDVKVNADNPTFAISGKRLQRIKVGDEDASAVTTNLTNLSVGSCPSVTVVDARNVSGLVGSIDLTKCTRLREALFGGSSAGEIILPIGSKITVFDLPTTLKNLSLVNLPNLTEDGLTYTTLTALTYLRVEGNDEINGYALLKAAMGEDSSITNIRIVGFDYDGDSTDVDLLAKLAEGGYYGIDPDGSINNNIIPVIEGTLNIAGSIYEDAGNTVKENFPNLTLNVKGGYYIRFADDEVLRVLLENITTDDGIGLTTEDIEGVTGIGTWFKGNAEIRYFMEFPKFINAQVIPAYAFDGSGLLDIDLSATPQIENFAFRNCSLTDLRVSIPKLEIVGYGAFMGSGIAAVDDLGEVVRLPYQSTNGVFRGCANLREVHLPSSLTSIGRYAFSDCVSLAIVDGWDNVTAIESYCFSGCTSLPQIFALPRSLITLDGYSFRSTSGLEWMIIPEMVTTIGGYAWNSSTNFKGVVCKATTPPTLGSYTGWGSSKIAYVPDDSVEAYKAATNWGSGQIHGFSEIPSDLCELIRDYL